MLRADGMPALVQQRPVTADAAWHGAQAQREPGIRRDVRAVQAGRPRLLHGDGVR